MRILIHKTEINTKLHDKRSEFGFDIVNYPDLSGCIPTSIGQSVISSQILRLARVITTQKEFVKSAIDFKNKVVRRGFREQDFEIALNKTMMRHKREFAHLYLSAGKLLEILFTTEVVEPYDVLALHSL